MSPGPIYGAPGHGGIASLDLAASQMGPLEGTSMEQLTDSHSQTVEAVAFATGGTTPPT